MRYYNFLLPLLLLTIILLIYKSSFTSIQVFATPSPVFVKQEIRDDQLDWVNMTTREFTDKGERSTDILVVNYFSDGKVLNSTFWLYFPFKYMPSNDYADINYGMLIDADFNNDTGVQGIDYQLEISWQNKSKSWEKVLKEISTTAEQRILDIEHNYTGFAEYEKNYVELSLNLSSIHYPNKYKVIFYAEMILKKENNNSEVSITDFTRWVAIPPLDLVIETSPPSLVLRPGEQKTVEVKINSTKGYEPTVYLSTANQSGEIKSYFKEGFEKLRIPSYGVATIPMIINATKDASIRPYTLFIFANSSFPSESLIKVKPVISNSPILTHSETSQNIITESSMRITVQEPLSDIDRISDFWNKLGAPIVFVYGIIAGISPWLFSKLKERLKKEEGKNNNSRNKK